MFLLGAVALCCTVMAGTLTLFEPISERAPDKQVADSRQVEALAVEPVRVVGGAPFVPNTNPRQR